MDHDEADPSCAARHSDSQPGSRQKFCASMGGNPFCEPIGHFPLNWGDIIHRETPGLFYWSDPETPAQFVKQIARYAAALPQHRNADDMVAYLRSKPFPHRDFEIDELRGVSRPAAIWRPPAPIWTISEMAALFGAYRVSPRRRLPPWSMRLARFSMQATGRYRPAARRMGSHAHRPTAKRHGENLGADAVSGEENQEDSPQSLLGPP